MFSLVFLLTLIQKKSKFNQHRCAFLLKRRSSVWQERERHIAYILILKTVYISIVITLVLSTVINIYHIYLVFLFRQIILQRYDLRFKNILCKSPSTHRYTIISSVTTRSYTYMSSFIYINTLKKKIA